MKFSYRRSGEEGEVKEEGEKDGWRRKRRGRRRGRKNKCTVISRIGKEVLIGKVEERGLMAG